MGLDSVELLVEIERTFGIDIPSKVAERINTVGQMYDVVWDLIRRDDSQQCRSQVLFYRLRLILKKEFHIDEAISPASITEVVIPQKNRRNVWKQLSEKLTLKLPQLVFPRTMVIIAFVSGLILYGILTWVLSFYFPLLPVGILYISGLVIGLMIVRVSSPLFDPFRTAVPYKTLRELTYAILHLNYVYLNASGGLRKEMELVINKILIERLGIDTKDISPEKSFVNDFGVD